jgi:hypothetical protein
LRVTAIIIILCPLLFGCFTNRYLSSPLEANQGKNMDHAEIVLRSGICIEAINIKVGNDTTHFMPFGTDSVRQVRTNEIERLIVMDHVAGAIDGFLAGVPIGLGTGILISELSGEFKKSSGNMRPLFNMVGGLAVGSIGGAVYWGIRGHHDNYIFPSDSIKGLTEQGATK